MNMAAPVCDDEGFYSPVQCYRQGACRLIIKLEKNMIKGVLNFFCVPGAWRRRRGCPYLDSQEGSQSPTRTNRQILKSNAVPNKKMLIELGLPLRPQLLRGPPAGLQDDGALLRVRLQGRLHGTITLKQKKAGFLIWFFVLVRIGIVFGQGPFLLRLGQRVLPLPHAMPHQRELWQAAVRIGIHRGGNN